MGVPFKVPNIPKGIIANVAQELIKLTVNGRSVQVGQGATILDAIKAAGARVPTLCHHPRGRPEAVCRMCMVEVEGMKKPVASCHTPALKGMSVTTDSKQLENFRKWDLKFLLSRHPNACMTCEASGSCKLQNLVNDYQVHETWPKSDRGSLKHPEHLLHDHTSPAIVRDLDKCIECGLCVQACAQQQINAIGFAERGTGRLPVTAFDEPLCNTNCISCGQCTWVCPVGAITERPDWHRVMDVLDAKRRVTVVETAPATRLAIGEEFGFDPGTISTGRMVNALRELGFDYVMDTNFAADLTIMEEANELLARIKNGGTLPLFTSCCPAWVNYLEIHRPELLPHLSTTKSPQQMQASVTKFGPFAKTIDDEEGPFMVSIMPCTAKKDEAVRPHVRGEVDAVLTTRELAKLIKHRGINFASLPNDGEYDSPLGESTGAAALFGATGGVLEAALRTAAHTLGIDAPLEWTSLRGVDSRVKVATIPGVGSVAACNSISAAIDLLSNESWRDDFLMIEVMTCPGGCIGGGGEPKSDDPDILQKRVDGIYKLDEMSELRMSQDNPEIKKLYEDFLDHPLSEKSELLLHTTYAPRGSAREKLMKFLSAVDFRDTATVESLFAEDGVWTTDEFGAVTGRDNICDIIENKLPAIPTFKPGMEPVRHRMTHHIEGTDVLTPKGDRVHFDVVLDDKGLIKTLTKTFLERNDEGAV